MVQAIDDNTLAIQFPAPLCPNDNNADADIHCELRITSGRMEILYKNHVIRTRASSSGPYPDERYYTLPLTPALRSIIEYGAMLEFWSSFAKIIRAEEIPGRTRI